MLFRFNKLVKNSNLICKCPNLDKSTPNLSKVAFVAFFICASLTSTSIAQSTSQPPSTNISDELGVNLPSGRFTIPGLSLRIGNSSSGLSASNDYEADSNTNFIKYTLGKSFSAGSAGTANFWVMNASFNGKSYSFTVGVKFEINQYSVGFNAGPYLEMNGNSKLECSDPPGPYYFYTGNCILTTEDGTKVIYDNSMSSISSDVKLPNRGYATVATRPDGEILTYNYYFSNGNTNIKSVQSSLGWMLKYDPSWYYTVGEGKIGAVNLSKNYCDLNALTCSYQQYASRILNNGGYSYSYTDNGIVTTNVNYAPGGTVTISTPSGASKSFNYWTFSDLGQKGYFPVLENRAKSATKSGYTWTYIYELVESLTRITVTQPDSKTRRVTLNAEAIFPYKYEDQLGRVTTYEYNGSRVSNVIYPDGSISSGGYIHYDYDANGNVTAQISYPKGGGSPITSSSSYASTCDASNYKYCHKPNYTIDAKGNRTDYTYDANTGFVTTETGPADNNGIRPQTRNSYTALSAKYLDANGVLQNFPSVYRLSRVSKCKTATAANPASCVGTAEELVTTYSYNSPNLFLTSETQSSGDGSLSITKSFTYDDVGNLVINDGPRTDVDDKSYATYDISRRKIYEIGIDPDGGGPLRRLTIHHNYDVDGRDWKIEIGTCGNVVFNGSLPSGCADFAVTSFTRNSYDSATGDLIKTETVTP